MSLPVKQQIPGNISDSRAEEDKRDFLQMLKQYCSVQNINFLLTHTKIPTQFRILYNQLKDHQRSKKNFRLDAQKSCPVDMADTSRSFTDQRQTCSRLLPCYPVMLLPWRKTGSKRDWTARFHYALLCQMCSFLSCRNVFASQDWYYLWGNGIRARTLK